MDLLPAERLVHDRYVVVEGLLLPWEGLEMFLLGFALMIGVIVVAALIIGVFLMGTKSRNSANAPKQNAPPSPTEPRPEQCGQCGAVLSLQAERCPICGQALAAVGTPNRPEETDEHGSPRHSPDSGERGA